MFFSIHRSGRLAILLYMYSYFLFIICKEILELAPSFSFNRPKPLPTTKYAFSLLTLEISKALNTNHISLFMHNGGCGLLRIRKYREHGAFEDDGPILASVVDKFDDRNLKKG
ncbi:hypothetical protein L2E82_16656 [Cichorium intybus]|uniref:Uncharacterized protein n=1 Tax=Cichorium intybus TaxID=13427 RepID=A0ACB9F659_CICIN|nr:hypothetical protein L2E82_16656 [Cichorium intybus]